jgi:hypothetical protein
MKLMLGKLRIIILHKLQVRLVQSPIKHNLIHPMLFPNYFLNTSKVGWWQYYNQLIKWHDLIGFRKIEKLKHLIYKVKMHYYLHLIQLKQVKLQQQLRLQQHYYLE